MIPTDTTKETKETTMTTATVDLTDKIAVKAEQSETGYVSIDRDEAIRAIRAALKRRSGKPWSVKGGRGTGWGWIEISAPPKRRTGAHVRTGRLDAYGNEAYDLVDTGEPQEFGLMTPQDCAELGELLSLGRDAHCQGVSVPSGSDYWQEYIARAEGRKPTKYGVCYWD